MINNRSSSGSWIVIVLALLVLGALLFRSILQFNPQANLQGGGQEVAQNFQSPAEVARKQPFARGDSPQFKLGLSRDKVALYAKLPADFAIEDVLSALSKRFPSQLRELRLVELPAGNDSPGWLSRLSDTISSIPILQQPAVIDYDFEIDSVAVSGWVSKEEDKVALLQALADVSSSPISFSSEIQVESLLEPSISLIKQNERLLLKGQLALSRESFASDAVLTRAFQATELDNQVQLLERVAEGGVSDRALSVLRVFANRAEVLLLEAGEKQFRIDAVVASQHQHDLILSELEIEIERGGFEFNIDVITPKIQENSPDSSLVNDVALLEDTQQQPSEKPVLAESEKSRKYLLAVHFLYNKADLSADSYVELDKLFVNLSAHPELRISIDGHTDSYGDPESNLVLSKMRAEAVRSYLLINGIDKSRIQVHGFGDVNPIADNSTREGRSMNRRIEIRELKS